MELIPILSMIILVATISTFLLAIGAYILYKVRERKGQEAVTQRQREIKAELVTPAESKETAAARPERVVPQPESAKDKPVSKISKQQRMFVQPGGTIPSQSGFTPQPKPYKAYRQQPSPSPLQKKGTEEKESEKNLQKVKSADTRFLKYTSEGYIPAKEDKDARALKWR